MEEVRQAIAKCDVGCPNGHYTKGVECGSSLGILILQNFKSAGIAILLPRCNIVLENVVTDKQTPQAVSHYDYMHSLMLHSSYPGCALGYYINMASVAKTSKPLEGETLIIIFNQSILIKVLSLLQMNQESLFHARRCHCHTNITVLIQGTLQ